MAADVCFVEKRGGCSGEIVPLSSCSKSTVGHLRYLKCSFEDISEAHLILNRAGLSYFTLPYDTTPVNDRSICKTHRDHLGIYWRPKNKNCAYPGHKGKCKPDRTVSLALSRDICIMYAEHVPVGSGICKVCRLEHQNELAERLPSKCKVSTDEDTRLKRVKKRKLDPVKENLQPISKNPHGYFEENEKGYLMEVLSCSKSQVSNNRLERDEAENDSFVKEMPPCSQSQISDDFIEFSSQSTIRSTHSSHEEWQPETSDLDKINNVIHLISNGNCSPLRSQLTTSFKEASVRTQRYYIQISKDIVLHLFEMIAPSQSHILIKELFSREFLWNNDDERVLKIFVKAYEDASDSPAHQKELLSLFSHQYPKELLLQSIPGMTKWRIDTARQHANTSSKNTEVTQKSAFSRLPFDKVEHFVDFLSQPHYIQDIAYGERTIKLSTGQSIHIPDVVRTLIGSRIITCYLSYCKDTEFSPCSRSTLYSLLNRCAASQRKSLSGLDNTTADGISSFEKLVSVTESMESYGLQPTKSEDIMNRLRASKHYLSCDNRWHIQRSTSIPDHCIDYSLSDHRHPELSSQCSHDHNDVCNFCTDQLTVLDDLEQIIIDGFFPTSDIKGEFIHDFQKCKEKIIQWKQHVLRNVCQEEAKQNILQTLERHEVLITMDWAMKYLPWIDREKQTDFFGKKGINWHISVAISKEKDHLKKDCFVHLLDSAPQTWFSVASILEHLLFTVKDQNESLKCAYLKSDNARCYHCGPLISAIPDISRRTGIKVCRYDFSEAQSGKDICDRRIAPLKIHMKRYGNEGHNITTGEEMKEALESYGGVKDTHVYLAEVDFDQQTMQKCPIPFINNFNNFCYEEDGLRMWQAYNVGEGKFISTGELNRKMIGKQDDTG